MSPRKLWLNLLRKNRELHDRFNEGLIPQNNLINSLNSNFPISFNDAYRWYLPHSERNEEIFHVLLMLGILPGISPNHKQSRHDAAFRKYHKQCILLLLKEHCPVLFAAFIALTSRLDSFWGAKTFNLIIVFLFILIKEIHFHSICVWKSRRAKNTIFYTSMSLFQNSYKLLISKNNYIASEF